MRVWLPLLDTDAISIDYRLLTRPSSTLDVGKTSSDIMYRLHTLEMSGFSELMFEFFFRR